MRRIERNTAVVATAVLIGGGALWVVPDLALRLDLAAVPDRAAERLSTVGLSVENVTVTGRANTDPAALLDALGAVRGTPILEIDVPLARKRITALPWVRSAEIVRQLPNNLHIALEEHTALALWQHSGRYTLFAPDGTLITDVETAPADLVIVTGSEAPAHAAALIQALATQPAISARVKAAMRLGQRRWNIILDDIESGVVVKLPEYDIETALQTLASLDAQHGLLDRALAEIDLRIAGTLVVKLLDGYAPYEPNTPNTVPAFDATPDEPAKNAKESADNV